MLKLYEARIAIKRLGHLTATSVARGPWTDFYTFSLLHLRWIRTTTCIDKHSLIGDLAILPAG